MGARRVSTRSTNALRIPTLVRLLPKAVRRKQKDHMDAVSAFPMALLSRRQYLSRMDRFQHGRSARTLGPEALEINKKCRISARFCLFGSGSRSHTRSNGPVWQDDVHSAGDLATNWQLSPTEL